MKRKVQIFLIAGLTVLSGIGGVAALLGTGLTWGETEAGAHLNQAGQAPIAVAGNCLGGCVSSKGDGDPKAPPSEGTDGNSWGG